MTTENRDQTIADIHRIRREIAAKFNGDLFAITADAQARMEASGNKIIRRCKSTIPTSTKHQIVELDTSTMDQPSPAAGGS